MPVTLSDSRYRFVLTQVPTSTITLRTAGHYRYELVTGSDATITLRSIATDVALVK